jgi:hypothetical protein
MRLTDRIRNKSSRSSDPSYSPIRIIGEMTIKQTKSYSLQVEYINSQGQTCAEVNPILCSPPKNYCRVSKALRLHLIMILVIAQAITKVEP